MSAARLPLAYRDTCAHLLIPLNRCRYEEWYLPWKCVVSLSRRPKRAIGSAGNCQLWGGNSVGAIESSANTMVSMQDERHSYEKCQYEEFKLRVKKMDEIREAKGGARSN